jgi:hypothetical protein
VRRQQTGVKPKTRERKLRSGVNWQRTLRQRGVKQTGRKQGLRVFSGFATFPDDSIFLFAQEFLERFAVKGPSECKKLVLYAFSDAELREVTVMNFTCILVLRTLKTQAFIPLRSY